MKVKAGLVLLCLIIFTVFFKLYGFLLLNDSNHWLMMADFFTKGVPLSRLPKFNVHWLVSPLSSAFAGVIANTFSVGTINGFLVLNLVSYMANGLLFYRLVKRMTGQLGIALIAAILFLVDFHTQQFTFAVMSDSLNWSFLLILLNLAFDFSQKSKILVKHAIGWGLVAGLAILTKANLGFLFFIFPAIIFMRKSAGWLTLSAISGLAFAVPVLVYYFWLSRAAAMPFLAVLFNFVVATPGGFIENHLTQYVSAFLYLLPFIIVGLWKNPFLPGIRKYILITLALSLTPVMLWPSIEPRHTYTLFWISLPLAAAGILRITRQKAWIILPLFLVLYFLNTSRNYLETHRMSHYQGAQKLYETYLYR